MDQNNFVVKILRQHWIRDDGEYDENDLCSHGEVYVKLATEELSTKETGSLTLSVAALYLLRSLEQDCQLYEFSNQLIPCCGFSIYPNTQKKNHVEILGCPNGVDWKITHQDGMVFFESERGSNAELSFIEYKNIVLKFVNEVERFYGNPKNKSIPEEPETKEGFIQFWAEWNELKEKYI